MKILFVVDTFGSDVSALTKALGEKIAHCKEEGFDVLIVELVKPDAVSLLNPEGITTTPVLNRGNASADVAYTFTALLAILKNRSFTPAIINFFDAYSLAYFTLQKSLLNIDITTRTPIVFTFTQSCLPDVYQKNSTTLQSRFQLMQLEFVLRGVDQVVCYSPQLKNELNDMGLIKDIHANSCSDNGDTLNTTQLNYSDLLIDANRKNDLYPFPQAKEFYVNGATPLLSVVIPYFNMGEFINETLDSVLRSTYQNIEILVVNDGSTDLVSIEELKKIKQKSDKIKIIDQQNSGVAEARNRGIRSSRGSIVALLDADDLVAETYFEKAVAILTRFKNISFTGCWTELFDDTGTIDKWITYNPEPPLYYLMNTINSQSIVVKKEALLQYGLHDKNLEMVLDDWESIISMVANDVRGVVIPEFLFRYRIRRNSVYRSNQHRWTTSYEKIIQKHFNLMSHHAKEMLLLLNTNGPNIFYKDPQELTDYYKLLHHLPNFRIRNGFLNKWISHYYNFVELNPVGIKLRNMFNHKKSSKRDERVVKLNG